MRNRIILIILFVVGIAFFLSYNLFLKDILLKNNVYKNISEGDIYLISNNEVDNKTTFIEFKKDPNEEKELIALITKIDVERDYENYSVNKIEEESELSFNSGMFMIPELKGDTFIDISKDQENLSVKATSHKKEVANLIKIEEEELDKMIEQIEESVESLNKNNSDISDESSSLKKKEKEINEKEVEINDDIQVLINNADKLNEITEELDNLIKEEPQLKKDLKKEDEVKCSSEEDFRCIVLSKKDFLDEYFEDQDADEINNNIMEKIEDASKLLESFLQEQKDSNLHSSISYDVDYIDDYKEDAIEAKNEYEKAKEKWESYDSF